MTSSFLVKQVRHSSVASVLVCVQSTSALNITVRVDIGGGAAAFDCLSSSLKVMVSRASIANGTGGGSGIGNAA
jgi:hypothetical protein